MIEIGPALVVAAHPDDETIGAGGTIARMADAGAHVTVLVVTRVGPYLGRYRHIPTPDLDAHRRVETWRACRVLGATEVLFGDFEETHLAARPFPALVEFIRDAIAHVHPRTIFTHSARELHQDHRAVCEATIIAARPFTLPPGTRRLLAYTSDVASWRDVPGYGGWFVDIAGTLDRKIMALQQYVTELRAFPHPRSPEFLRAQATYLGSLASRAAAEVFEVVWEVV